MLEACGSGDGGVGGGGGGKTVSTSASSSASGLPGYCSAADLGVALQRARSGNTVTIGACEIAGSFVVPAGVTLIGQGIGRSTVHGPSGKPALQLTPGGVVSTKVSDLSILSDGTAGILAKGMGAIDLTRVEVTPKLGIGLGAEGVTALNLKAVKLTGPVTAQNADAAPYPPSPQKTATHGAVLVDVGKATLTDVLTSGFADFGALFVRSTVVWSNVDTVDGGASGNLGTGLMVVGGSIDLEGITLSDTLQGKRLIPAYGAIFTDHVQAEPVGATLVTSTGLKVMKNSGTGILHDGAQVNVHHTGLVAQGNGAGGIWAQNGAGTFVLDGPLLDNNYFAGLIGLNMAQVGIKGGHFNGTKKRTIMLGNPPKSMTLGDGIHLVSSTNLHVESVDLPGNERVGMMLDVGATDPIKAGFMWLKVTVEAPAGQYGALCQGTYMGGQLELWQNAAQVNPWDSGIVRDKPTLATDTGMLPSPMGIAGVIGPDILPAPITVIKSGVTGLIAP